MAVRWAMIVVPRATTSTAAKTVLVGVRPEACCPLKVPLTKVTSQRPWPPFQSGDTTTPAPPAERTSTSAGSLGETFNLRCRAEARAQACG